jgi:hypothetical protein
MDLHEVKCTALVQKRDRWRALVNAVVSLWVPKIAGNIPTSRETVIFSGRIQLHEVS